MEIKFDDLFDHLAELEVQRYLANFPYWRSNNLYLCNNSS